MASPKATRSAKTIYTPSRKPGSPPSTREKTMSVPDEILALEEQLRQAALAPDTARFERALADDVVLDRQLQNSKVVAAHQPSAVRAERGPDGRLKAWVCE